MLRFANTTVLTFGYVTVCAGDKFISCYAPLRSSRKCHKLSKVSKIAVWNSFYAIHKFRFRSVLAYALIQNHFGERLLFVTKLVLLLFSSTSQVSSTTDNRSTNHQRFSAECPSPTWPSKTSQASFLPDQECCSSGFGVLGTRFGSLEWAKVIIGCLESEKSGP